MYNIVLNITTAALYDTRVLFTMSYIYIVLAKMPTLYEGIQYQCTEWLWKIVLLTLAAYRGFTDLYPS